MVCEISNKQIYTRFEQQQNVGYRAPIEECEPYLIDNLASLVLCPKCFRAHGNLRLSDGKCVEQRCDCDKEVESNWVYREGLRWDFNTAYETCYCCGLEVISSGSKWNSFFCKDCQKAIREFNNAAGQCIIPIGRHSLMNGIGITKSDPSNKEASIFVNEIKSLTQGLVNVHEHKTLILRRQLKALQLPEDASLMMLTQASFYVDRKQAKTEALQGIIAHVIQVPIEKVAELLIQEGKK